MLSDDVFRDRLSTTIGTLEAWADGVAGVAHAETSATAVYWRMAVRPATPGACRFDLLLQANQRFSLDVAGERYEDKPIDRLEFFPMLVRAIERGYVERIETRNAMTGALELVECRIVLDDGWAWIGERRVGLHAAHKLGGEAHIRNVHRFLPYRR